MAKAELFCWACGQEFANRAALTRHVRAYERNWDNGRRSGRSGRDARAKGPGCRGLAWFRGYLSGCDERRYKEAKHGW